MPDDKSLGKRILGLFVETVGDAQPTPTGEPTSPAEEIAQLARQSVPTDATPPPTGPMPGVGVSPPRSPMPVVNEPVAPAKIDFDSIFKSGGVDPAALERVRKAEELLKTLPDGASDEVKRQIVEASLKAFGFEISKIVEGVETQQKALDTFVKLNEQQTSKSIADAQAQIAKLEDQVITLRADIDKRTTNLASLAAAADVRRRQISKVLNFFRSSPAPAQTRPASETAS